MVDAPKPPRSDDGYWVHTLKIVFGELEALGLSILVPKPLRQQREPDPGDQRVSSGGGGSDL